MRWKAIYWWFVVPVIVSLVSLSIGRFPIPFSKVWEVLINMFSGSNSEGEYETVILSLRMPRVLIALLIGSALSSSGAAYQALFRNPLASPDILGVTAGAGFGGLLAMLLGYPMWTVWLCATGFGLVAMSLTAFIARSSKEYRIGFLLAGLIVTTVFSSLISLLKILADPHDQLPAMVFWLMGSLSYSEWSTVRWMSLPLILGTIILMLIRWRLNLLMLNTSEARGLGVNMKWSFYGVIFVVTIMTAVIVSAVGIVGWVGLVVPHVARLFVGENNRQLIPMSAILGASYLVIMDTLARSISAQEIPIGILTAIGGAAVFIIVWKFMVNKRINYD